MKHVCGMCRKLKDRRRRVVGCCLLYNTGLKRYFCIIELT